MDPVTAPPFTTSIDLPPYRAILAVDAKGFTAEPGSTHQAISGLIPQLVGDAFADAGLQPHWNRPHFLGPTGDGFAVGLPTEILPYLVHPLPQLLQQRLTAHNHSIRYGEARIQLRMSVNVGPLPADPADPHWTGNGTARNDTHRLLDSRPVKMILASASSHTTFLACILSDRVFQDVVADGYTGRHPDHFLEVSATVGGKPFAQRAWLYVPEISGNLLGLLRTEPQGPPDPPAGRKRPPSSSGRTGGPQVNTNHGQVGGTVESMNQNVGGGR